MKHSKPLLIGTKVDHSALEWVPDSRSSKAARERSLKYASLDHAAMVSTIRASHSDTLVSSPGFRVDPAQFGPIETWTADDPIPRPIGDAS